MPIFDRLVDLAPGSPRDDKQHRTLDRHGLHDSVRRELLRLLNTRLNSPTEPTDGRERTVLDYGIPDFSPMSAVNAEDRAQMAGVIERAIEAFEPRLTGVRVEFQAVPGNDRAVTGWIEASLLVGEVPEPVSFRTVFHSEAVEVEVEAVARE